MELTTHEYTVTVTQTSESPVVSEEDLRMAVAEIAARYETDENRVETIEVTRR